jgi:maleamate amidohydrolase
MTPPPDKSLDDHEMIEVFRSRGFGNRLGFGERPAILVIDYSNGFTNPEMPLGSDLDDEIAATRVLLDCGRRAQIPILYTTVSYDEHDAADAGPWLRKQSGLITLKSGTKTVELDARLGRMDREPLIVKKAASAFFGTNLVTRLSASRCDTIIVAGCTTSGCVRASVVDAMQLGFIPVVVRDAVGDRVEQAHRQSLIDINEKYGDVVSLTDAVKYLGKL